MSPERVQWELGKAPGLGGTEVIMQRRLEVKRGQISVCSEEERRFTVTPNLTIN